MPGLQQAIDTIAAQYVFDEVSYPSLRGKSKEEVTAFAVQHSALHMAKSLGKIAAVSEAVDHGDAINSELLKEATVKMFINVLRLAEVQGLTADQLIDLIPKYMRSAAK